MPAKAVALWRNAVSRIEPIWRAPLLGFLLLFSTEASSQYYDKSYAIVVGIDHYGSPEFPRLNRAVSDAHYISQYLKSIGYQVFTLVDDDHPTRDRIISTIRMVAEIATENDSVLFFFGGHGHTEVYGERRRGYIVPSDSRLISMHELTDLAALLDTSANHVLFVLNSCYGGTIRESVRESLATGQSLAIADLLGRGARQWISAGQEDQLVLDGGPGGMSWFAYFFLEGLAEGYAQQNADDVIMFSELVSFLLPRAGDSEVQTPGYGMFAGHAGGEYLFPSGSMAASPNQPAFALPALETATMPRPDVSPDQVVDLQALRDPIDSLFASWERLDLELYMSQWSADAIQYVDGRSRTMPELRERRDAQFNREFARVEVVEYRLDFPSVNWELQSAVVEGSYTMRFHYRDGRIIEESGYEERYVLEYFEDIGEWRIVRNDDYLSPD